jgi:hypothetical protein
MLPCELSRSNTWLHDAQMKTWVVLASSSQPTLAPPLVLRKQSTWPRSRLRVHVRMGSDFSCLGLACTDGPLVPTSLCHVEASQVTVRSRPPLPEESESCPVPADNRLRLYDDKHIGPAGPDTTQGRPKQSIHGISTAVGDVSDGARQVAAGGRGFPERCQSDCGRTSVLPPYGSG